MKTCTACSELKSLDEYRKTNLSADGHANICKVCAKLRRDAKRGQQVEATEAAEPEALPEGGLEVGPALGFRVYRQNGDIIIEQPNDGGMQTIWLSDSEARRLATWINLETTGES